MANKVIIRPGKESDKEYLTKWLEEPGVLKWFPMYNRVEIDDAVKLWISYYKYGALLTAEVDGEPAGIVNLYLQPYKKLAHHSLLAIIVGEKFRNKGVGTALLKDIEKLAKETFHLEILHLEVYEGNPAKNLYLRMGFEEYGFQKKFLKDEGEYLGKYFMQKRL